MIHFKEFKERASSFGKERIIRSADFYLALAFLIVAAILTKGNLPQEESKNLLSAFITVSASLFGLVLAGLSLISSLSSKEFTYAWKKLEEYNDMMFLFEFNLYLPLIVLLSSLFLRYYFISGYAVLAVSALFLYMILSLMDLVHFITKYGIQRGKFIERKMEAEKKDKQKKNPSW